MRNILTIILILIVTSLSINAQDFKSVKDLSQFETKLSEKSTIIKSIESPFIQEKYLDVFDEKIKSTGVFYYKEGNKVCLKYNKPVDYLIVINQSLLKVVSDGKTSITDLSKNKMMIQMQELIVASIIGDLSKLDREYDVLYLENKTHYFIKLLPKNKTVKSFIHQIDILLDKETMAVDRLKMSETETDYTEYHFYDKKFNTTIDEAIFKIR